MSRGDGGAPVTRGLQKTDAALLRRLEKRIHVPFPSAAARAWIAAKLLPRASLAADVRAGLEPEPLPQPQPQPHPHPQR